MANTVKIPGVGSVPTKYALLGGAAVVGIAGVAWFRYANRPEEVEDTGTTTDFTGVDETVYPAYATDYAPDESYDGGAYPYPTYTTPSYGLTSTVQTADPITNSEWTQRSIEHLELVGVESQAGSLAVSRYLLKECVTATQADMVRQAVAALGPPPQGTFSIVVCPTTPGQKQEDTPPSNPGKPARVTGLRATGVFRNHVDIDWNPVTAPAGVNVGYTIWANGVRKTSNVYTQEHVWNLKPNTTYKIEVAAVYVDATGPGTADVYGPRTAITVKTKK